MPQIFDVSLLTELESIGVNAKDVVFEFHKVNGDYSAAQNTLNSMTASNTEQTNWKEVLQLELDVLVSGRNLSDITTSEKADLLYLIQNAEVGDEGKTHAESWLAALGYPIPNLVPRIDYSLNNAHHFEQFEIPESFEVGLFPNPASNYTRLQYQVNLTLAAQIRISDLSGKTVLLQNLISEVTDHLIDVRNFESGVYFIEVIENNQISWTEKLVKL